MVRELGWLLGRLLGWLVGWLVGGLVGGLIGGLVGGVVGWMVGGMAGGLVGGFEVGLVGGCGVGASIHVYVRVGRSAQDGRGGVSESSLGFVGHLPSAARKETSSVIRSAYQLGPLLRSACALSQLAPAGQVNAMVYRRRTGWRSRGGGGSLGPLVNRFVVGAAASIVRFRVIRIWSCHMFSGSVALCAAGLGVVNLGAVVASASVAGISSATGSLSCLLTASSEPASDASGLCSASTSDRGASSAFSIPAPDASALSSARASS